MYTECNFARTWSMVRCVVCGKEEECSKVVFS